MHVIGKTLRRACGQSEERFEQIDEKVQIAHASTPNTHVAPPYPGSISLALVEEVAYT